MTDRVSPSGDFAIDSAESMTPRGDFIIDTAAAPSTFNAAWNVAANAVFQPGAQVA